MIIKAILVALLLLIGLNFIGSRNSSRTKAIKKLVLLVSIPLGSLLVLWPSASTRIANAVGVGRGTDLLFYIFALALIFQLFDNYVKSQHDQRKFVQLNRRIALLEANAKKASKH